MLDNVAAFVCSYPNRGNRSRAIHRIWQIDYFFARIIMVCQIATHTADADIRDTGTSQNHLCHLLCTQPALVINPAVFLKTSLYICRRNHADNRSDYHKNVRRIPIRIIRIHFITLRSFCIYCTHYSTLLFFCHFPLVVFFKSWYTSIYQNANAWKGKFPESFH